MGDQHYSSEDEEVFFGSLAESEVLKRRHFLGDNYNSPVTPRPPRFNHVSSGIQENVSGILGASNTSTPVQRQPSVVSCGNNQSTYVAPDGSSPKGSDNDDDDDDDDIIILDYTRNSDSIIILSDDESFMQNERTCARKSLRSNEENQSKVNESGSTSGMSNKSETVEVSKLHNESFLSDEVFITDHVSFENKSPSKLGINNSENGSLLTHNSSLKNVEMSSHDITANESNDSFCNVESGKSSLVQDIIPVDDVEMSSHDITANESNDSVCNVESGKSSLVQDIIPVDDVENENVVEESGSFSEIYNKDITAEVNKFLSDQICLAESVITEDKPSEKSVNIFENLLSHNSLLNDVVTTSQYYDSNMEKSSSSIVQDINNFVGDSSVVEKYSAPVIQDTVDNSSFTLGDPQNLNLSARPLSSEEKAPTLTSYLDSDSTSLVQPSELQKNTKIIRGINSNGTKNHGNSSFDMSGLSNLEFSLNGITDSILNISHGSSLPSPPETRLHSSPNIYEDISYDDAKLDDGTDVSNIARGDNQEDEDLHMSVDEVNFQQQEFSNDFGTSCTLGTSIDTSQPSEYKSCPSSHSSYNTANNRTYGGNCSTSEQSDAFQNYRDTSSDLNMCKERDSVSSESDKENINECSFEMPMQNYQNPGSPVSEIPNTNKGELKVTSKLPIYKNTKSLLRPPKLFVKPDTLKTTSYKFAKQISKLESDKSTSNIPSPGMLKSAGPKPLDANKDATSKKETQIPLVKGRTFTKTPAKVTPTKQNLLLKPKTPMSTSSLTKLKTPSLSHLPVMKTPVQNIMSKIPGQNNVSKTPANLAVKKTPAQNKSGIPKAVKSDSKVMRVPTPLSRCYSTEQIGGSSQKSKYKNVISPIHAYIRGSPPVFLRNAKIKGEEHEVYDPSGKKIYQSTSQNVTPMKSQNITPMKSQKVTPMKSAPKAAQMLKYESAQLQENINPNVLNLTRDTVPSKILEPSLQVFWKEQEEPRLPKMGEKLTKILTGTPKVKLTAHKGRVNQSPSCNGILVPNKENSPTSFIAPSDSSQTSDADNLCEGRISIRVQKTMELP